MSDVIIKVEGLGKSYRLHHQRQDGYVALRDVLTEKARAIGRKVLGKGQTVQDLDEEFWALRNISFEVRQGEVLGIIGRNGAGKSTLLKILSRITEPTEGRVRIRGRVASLLEVGTGFHPELSGRENIYLNGAILGMTRAEVRRKFDEIVAFAEVEKFLDTPVKRYSSGMYVRLAFAVAAHLEPEILVVDEVLAVGDVEFQKKCLGKMQNVSKSGRTVLFVSHNMAAIETLCAKGIYLHRGKIRILGGVREVVHQYLADCSGLIDMDQTFPKKLSSEISLEEFSFTPETLPSGQPLRFKIRLSSTIQNNVKDFAVLLYSEQGVRVSILDLRLLEGNSTVRPDKPWEAAGTIDSLNLVEGIYSLGLYINCGDCNGDIYDLRQLRVIRQPSMGVVPPYDAQYRGFIDLRFTVDYPHIREDLSK
jgi:lipopolysaccharide transport system ATP-binding protein